MPDADLEIAHAALATFDETLLYARVDLVEHEGATLVSELECIEPSLFLGTNLRRVRGSLARSSSGLKPFGFPIR